MVNPLTEGAMPQTAGMYHCDCVKLFDEMRFSDSPTQMTKIGQLHGRRKISIEVVAIQAAIQRGGICPVKDGVRMSEERLQAIGEVREQIQAEGEISLLLPRAAGGKDQ